MGESKSGDDELNATYSRRRRFPDEFEALQELLKDARAWAGVALRAATSGAKDVDELKSQIVKQTWDEFVQSHPHHSVFQIGYREFESALWEEGWPTLKDIAIAAIQERETAAPERIPSFKAETPSKRAVPGAHGNADFWRDLRSEFDALLTRQRAILVQETRPEWLKGRCHFFEEDGEFGRCERQGGFDGTFISHFDEVATRSACALGCPPAVEPVVFWIFCLGKDLLKAKDPMIRGQFVGLESVGCIQGLLESSVGYCSRLAAKAERKAVKRGPISRVPNPPASVGTSVGSLAPRRSKLLAPKSASGMSSVDAGQSAFSRVLESFRPNPHAEDDPRHLAWEDFSAAKCKQVTSLIAGLRDLTLVVDEATYAEWRARHPEAPAAYEPDRVADWLGRGGCILIRNRFDTIVLEALQMFVRSPDDLGDWAGIVERLAAGLRVSFGQHSQSWPFNFEQWKEWKLEFAKEFVENLNLPPRRWRIDPYDRERTKEKRFTPLIARLMRACGEKFEHGRQAVDACLDLVCREGLSDSDETIFSLGEVLITICERLEIDHPAEATSIVKLLVQFKKLVNEGLGDCSAIRLLAPLGLERPPLSAAYRSKGALSDAPAPEESRKFLYISFRNACKAAGVRMTEKILAKLVNPAWSTRDPIAKWKQGQDRPGDDAKIRVIIAHGPPKKTQKA